MRATFVGVLLVFVIDQIIAFGFATAGRGMGPSSVLMKLRGGGGDGEGALGVPGALPIHQYATDDNNLTDKDIVRAHEDSLRLYEAMSQCEDGYIAQKLHSAMEILSDSIRLYGPEQLFSGAHETSLEIFNHQHEWEESKEC